MGRFRGTGLLVSTVLFAVGCGGDFDTSRDTPPRGSLGQEIYSLVCDRVGAQALREDVTGISYHGICHPDPVTGAYATTVDRSLLTPLDPGDVDTSGNPVSLDRQQANRDYRVARVETLGQRRGDIVRAFDAAIPDVQIAIQDLANPDPTQSCNAPAASGEGSLRKELSTSLGRITDLYDDRTIPLLTEAFAHVLDTVKVTPEEQAAFTRMDARQGYRPGDIAIGAARPILSYPRIVDFANSLLRLVATDSDPYNPAGAIDPSLPLGVGNRKPIPGKAAGEMQQLLRVMHHEMRTSVPDPTPDPLVVALDTNDLTRPLLSRPRGDLELARAILSQDDDAYASGPTGRFIVERDGRGVALVALDDDGHIPAPFVDANGDGLADLDKLGQFVTSDGTRVTSPFFSLDGHEGSRDKTTGLALKPSGKPLYQYVDTSKTFLASVSRSIYPMLEPAPTGKEAIVGILGGMTIVSGSRDPNPAATKTYSPDPDLVTAWGLQHTAPPPGNLGAEPVSLEYRAFHPEDSPLADLVYAVGQVLADPTTDDTLNLFRQLLHDHPKELARLIGVGLKIKEIASKHPEAQIPEQSTLWDELLDAFAQIAAVYDPQKGGILEDLITAFGTDQTLALKDVFTAYIANKDEFTYQNAQHAPASGAPDLNGPAFDLTTNAMTPIQTPVDRTLPDVGENRSELQRFMQLLHDANGLGACTKQGAVAHLTFPVIGTINYPTDFAVKAACATFGGGNIPPDPMPACGILRIPNVAELLLAVALGRATFDIPDPCLNALLNNSTLTGLVGGPDAFLEGQSGINGFSLHPTVNGVARLVYYDTPHDGDPGDPSFPKTRDFLKDVLDPVASMVCDPDPTAPPGIPLRKCNTFADTLRGRDLDSLFPLEELNFIKNVQPLAAAFDDHGKPLLFVQLFDTLHMHWGSPAQPKDVCDPSLPKTNARWCSQDAAVSYEPLLAEALQTDLFPALHDFVPLVKATKVNHCLAMDAATGVCTSTEQWDGVHVLSEAVRALLDPARSTKVGLTRRDGSVSVTRNDGSTNPQVTPIYLLIDALKHFDSAFADFSASNGNDTKRHDAWRSARSQLTDTFFGVNGVGTTSDWADAALPVALPMLIDAVRGQIAARCPSARLDGNCPWARQELTGNMTKVISGPTYAAVMDLIEAIRTDDAARTEVEKLLQYLLGTTSTDAQRAMYGAVHDSLQLFEDDANFVPLLHTLAAGTGETLLDEQGNVVRRSVVDAMVELLARVLARAYDGGGHEICAQEIDPAHTLAKVIGAMVTPIGPNDPAPIELLIDVVASVNRAHPTADSSVKLDAGDYANIANEVSDFCENKERGLEQVYEVIREATIH